MDMLDRDLVTVWHEEDVETAAEQAAGVEGKADPLAEEWRPGSLTVSRA